MGTTPRKLVWEERREGRAWLFRLGARPAPGRSLAVTIAVGAVLALLALAGPAAAGCGLGPAVGVLEMAIPVGLVGVLVILALRGRGRGGALRVDPERLVHGETTLPLGDVHDVILGVWGGVDVVDREGRVLLHLATEGPAYVAARLLAAIDEVRGARTYRR